MKLLIGVTAVLAISAASATAGDGRLTNHALANVGLGGMKVMSDYQGLEIRGLGVSEGTGLQGQEGSYGRDHHQKGDKYGKHEEKCGQHEGCCGKECGKSGCGQSCCNQSGCKNSGCGQSSCCQSGCNFTSLCNIQASTHK